MDSPVLIVPGLLLVVGSGLKEERDLNGGEVID
jgi:hypothetical protein